MQKTYQRKEFCNVPWNLYGAMRGDSWRGELRGLSLTIEFILRRFGTELRDLLLDLGDFLSELCSVLLSVCGRIGEAVEPGVDDLESVRLLVIGEAGSYSGLKPATLADPDESPGRLWTDDDSSDLGEAPLDSVSVAGGVMAELFVLGVLCRSA